VKTPQRRELAVCGYESVKSLAAARPDAVRRFFCVDARVRDFGPLCSRLAALKRPYRVVTPAELERLCGSAHHQGVVAMVDDEPPKVVDDALVETWARAGARLAVLDRVGDDHNLGSIARSAAFFGWTALILGRDDGAARLSTSAYRVARGALERVPVYADETAARFVERCRGRIQTIGADHRGDAPLQALGPVKGALALVLGNEETGLSPAARKACSRLVRVDGSGSVESLNVSQAAAVFLYELSPLRGG